MVEQALGQDRSDSWFWFCGCVAWGKLLNLSDSLS